VTVAVLHFRRRRKLPGVILLILACYFLLMLPVINLAVHLMDTQGERFVYLPSAFGIMLLTALLLYIAPRFEYIAAVLACLVVAFALLLARSNTNWRRASEIAGNVTASLSAFPAGSRVFLLNQPDNIRGAYVFRNGLNEAARVLRLVRGGTEFIPVYYMEMEQVDDTVCVEEAGSVYRVSLSNPAGRMRNRALSADGTLHTGQFHLLSLGPDSYEVRFREAEERDVIAVYGGAGLKTYR